MNLEATWTAVLEKLASWLDTLIIMLPNFGAAILIVIAAALLARLVRHVVEGVLGRASRYHHVNRLLATISYILVLGTGLFIALGVLNLDKTVTSLLAGVGIIGLALGFAFQDIAANFISGVLLSIRRPFREGEIVESNDYTGVISELNLRATHIRTFQGQLVIIPNKDVFQNPLVNFSRQRRRRVDLVCGVAYGDDLERAREIAVEAISGLEMRDSSREVELFYDEFGESSINFKLRFWIDFAKQTDFLHAQSEAIMRLKRAFDENDITIPFPIRTLDFGVVGGEKLSEALPEQLYSSGDAPPNR